ncbi:zinc-finger domain-containing protein [Pallidibacillus thermolactis]|uniref:zinc-finger domain-containing protein n=1 Tax=Pallidibacillus thermolactis TaxID=251051 RepID=UPI002E225032|nr:zinc-finger domain-containing protein [Pallidibacillus thermolactis subsp. kokeshiiformis]
MKIDKQLLDDLDTLLKNYCDGCFLARHFRKEKGKRYAHNFCIHECTVGLEIKKIGERLSGNHTNKSLNK